jgi:decaprenylphospho-beta-D-ribofuranose 2-oxidase
MKKFNSSPVQLGVIALIGMTCLTASAQQKVEEVFVTGSAIRRIVSDEALPIQIITKNEIQTIERFFYPLDFVKEWNRIYGNEGFLQYQIVIPEKNMFLISEIIETFSKVKCPIFLTVLKKMGNSNLGILSFPLKGWTLAFDIPAGFQDLNQILDKLDERIIEFGGRVYLAKDSRINSRVLREMYPRIDEFMSIRRKYDPNLVIQSDLARRLYL